MGGWVNICRGMFRTVLENILGLYNSSILMCGLTIKMGGMKSYEVCPIGGPFREVFWGSVLR